MSADDRPLLPALSQRLEALDWRVERLAYDWGAGDEVTPSLAQIEITVEPRAGCESGQAFDLQDFIVAGRDPFTGAAVEARLVSRGGWLARGLALNLTFVVIAKDPES